MGLLALRQAALLHEHGWVRPAIFGFRPSHVGFPGIASASRAPNEKHQVQNCGPTQFAVKSQRLSFTWFIILKKSWFLPYFLTFFSPFLYVWVTSILSLRPAVLWHLFESKDGVPPPHRKTYLDRPRFLSWEQPNLIPKPCPKVSHLIFPLPEKLDCNCLSFGFLTIGIWKMAEGSRVGGQNVLPQLFDLRTPLGRLLSHEGKYMQMQMLPMNSTLPNVATKWSCFKLLLKLGPVSHGAATPVKDTGSWASSAFRRMWH